MEGVKFTFDEKQGVYFFLINELSDALKVHIRTNLVSICEGEYHSEKFSAFHTYEITLKTFLERFQPKADTTKIGMVGELLCHLLLPIKMSNYLRASPYFNMEENSIKKGHDLIFFDKNSSELWITEVKSGEKGAVENTTIKTTDLLGTAGRDLISKLNGSGTNLWRNALKGMDSVIRDGISKDVIVKELSEYQKRTVGDVQKSEEYNVILTSNVFHDTDESIVFDEVLAWTDSYSNRDRFKNIIFLSIQKGTYQKIVDFLESELSENTSGVA